MRYDPESITTEAITLDADYQGWRIRFRGLLGNARVPMQVHVGIGNVVYSRPVIKSRPPAASHRCASSRSIRCPSPSR